MHMRNMRMHINIMLYVMRHVHVGVVRAMSERERVGAPWVRTAIRERQALCVRSHYNDQ